jgi:ubiquinone/menaquinone biosynthesis C-methylase UbiE
MMTKSAAAALIRKGVNSNNIPQHWADLGCGSGIFTEAIAGLLPPHSTIMAVDVNHQSLPRTLGKNVSVQFVQADFIASEINIQALDGILMANALHFVQDKTALIQKLEKYMNDHARFLIVEYDHHQSNQWEPYPIPYTALQQLFEQLDYTQIEKISERESIYGGKMFAALISKKQLPK